MKEEMRREFINKNKGRRVLAISPNIFWEDILLTLEEGEIVSGLIPVSLLGGIENFTFTGKKSGLSMGQVLWEVLGE